MDKDAKKRLNQRIINNLMHKLFHIEIQLKHGCTGCELQLLEEQRAKIELRLMELQGEPVSDLAMRN